MLTLVKSCSTQKQNSFNKKLFWLAKTKARELNYKYVTINSGYQNTTWRTHTFFSIINSSCFFRLFVYYSFVLIFVHCALLCAIEISSNVIILQAKVEILFLNGK